MRIQKTFQRLFCRHDWKKTGFFQDEDPEANIRYSIRRYQCRKCGKVSCQDGRFDRIEAKLARSAGENTEGGGA